MAFLNIFNHLVTFVNTFLGYVLLLIDRALESYSNFVASQSPFRVFLAGATTAFAGTYCFLQLDLPLTSKVKLWIQVGVFLYQGLVGTALYMNRGKDQRKVTLPEANPANPANPQYPHVRIFFKSTVPVGSLAIFTSIDDLFKSMKTIFSPCFFFCIYLHVLTIFAHLRTNDQYGISDAFLAAAYGLLFNLCSTQAAIYSLTVATIVLTGIRNLQFHMTLEIRERNKRQIEFEIELDRLKEDPARRAKAAAEAAASSKKSRKKKYWY